MALPHSETGARATGSGGGRRILIVDDEELIRWSLREGLSERGYHVLEAGTAAEGLTLLDEGVDLVLLDYRLPDGNGLDLTDRIRRSSPSCPVLLMTAYGTPAVRDGAARRNVLRVFEKPFDVPEVVECVTTTLRSASARQARR